jgi:hypothetical protein
MEEILKKVLPMLSNLSLDYSGYWEQPIPSEVDNDIDRLIDAFIRAPPAERKLLMERVSDNHSSALFGYSERMASLGVRGRSRQRLLNGLLAHVIENSRYDIRENLRRFSLFYDAALKLNILPEELFSEAASYANPRMVKDLEDFTRRDAESRSIEAMGYKETEMNDGFRYANDDSWF